VALVTARPGVTNAMTGIANAHVARAPVLVLSGVPPRPQENRGALQDIVHTDCCAPITRYARTVREPALVLQELDEAVARAAGQGGEPGPVYLDFPTDTLRARCRSRGAAGGALPAPSRARCCRATPIDRAAVDLLWSARPLVISGRGARGAGDRCAPARRARRALSRHRREQGAGPDDHPSVVAAMRGA
jgi:acetolactate synthase I/II/III large subunit